MSSGADELMPRVMTLAPSRFDQSGVGSGEAAAVDVTQFGLRRFEQAEAE